MTLVLLLGGLRCLAAVREELAALLLEGVALPMEGLFLLLERLPRAVAPLALAGVLRPRLACRLVPSPPDGLRAVTFYLGGV